MLAHTLLTHVPASCFHWHCQPLARQEWEQTLGEASDLAEGLDEAFAFCHVLQVTSPPCENASLWGSVVSWS